MERGVGPIPAIGSDRRRLDPLRAPASIHDRGGDTVRRYAVNRVDRQLSMRIAHLLGWYYPESVGGTEIYVLELCRRLSRHGYETAVAAPLAGADKITSYSHDGVNVFRYPIPAVPTRD